MTRNQFGILIAILICAIGLRFYGLDWGTDQQTGQFHAFHPDEKTLVESSAQIGQNMRNIVASYGKAPMYLLAATVRTFALITDTTPFTDTTVRFTHLTARSISALLGSLTIFLTFLIGRKFINTHMGLLSAFFLAFCTGHIQQSHYYTVDISLTFWITLALYIALQLPKSHTRLYIAFGVVIGIAAGTRLVGVWMGIPFVLVHLLHISQRNSETEKQDTLLSLNFSLLRSSVVWKKIAIAVTTGVALLLICEPFLILDPTLFFSDDDARRLIPSMQIARGEIVHIWTLYDFSTTPFLFYFTHLLRDALGYPLECVALLGIIFTIYKRSTTGLILLGWLVPYFLLVGGLHTKPIRYTTPMLPTLCILGAYASLMIGQWLQTHLKLKWAIALPSILIAVPTLIYALTFTSIYHQEDSRILAARWIDQNIPQNASVLTERGGFPTQWMASPNRYRVKTDQAKFLLNTEGFIPYWEQIAYIDDLLKTVDWIISINENRSQQFAGASAQYPIGHDYYHKLKTQSLGFEIHKQFQTVPLLFHRTDSDPTVTAYDHPKVTIYHRTGDVNRIIASWREQVKSDPSLPDHAFIAGIQAYKNQNWAEAKKAFQKAVDIRPNYLLAQVMIVNTLIKSGHRQEADDLWQELDTKFGGMPDEIGMGLSKAGLYHEGIFYLERSFAYYTQNGGLPKWIPKSLAESWYLLGQTLQAQKQYAEAKTAYQQVIILLPEFDIVYQNLGEIYLSENQPNKALPLFEKAMARNLRNAEAWYLIGQAYYMQGDIAKAKMHISQAMGLAPQEERYRKTFETLTKP
ncbi:MAG: tetratricopeptide repeat protein [Candidatus Latescibacteria bacterium]|nr:tetratricopeptide repeat protein [Candidatus Latescibacterota bacterium]